jgi:hypothetical protein
MRTAAISSQSVTPIPTWGATRRNRWVSVIATVGALTATGFAAGGCGGGSDGGQGIRSRAAPPAGDFPRAKGKTLQQVMASATTEGPVVSPGARVLPLGRDRFAFGVFTLGKEQISDAQVAIYAAPGNDLGGPAIGPFPARIEDLTTEPAFVAKSTAADADAAQVVYVSEIPLKRPGPWTFGALVKEGSGYGGSLLPTPSMVGQFEDIPAVGERAPPISTPTVSDVGRISEIDTRSPADSMHEVDYADVLGKEPIVLLFATPALCQSRVCGPVVDIAEQAKREVGDQAVFIHMEVYNDNDISEGPRPQVKTFRLPSEPWLFVIDADGVVRTRIEGGFSVQEVQDAVREVTK